eukprot:scaffold598_cov318-Pavlova_lutheri.AAC.25
MKQDCLVPCQSWSPPLSVAQPGHPRGPFDPPTETGTPPLSVGIGASLLQTGVTPGEPSRWPRWTTQRPTPVPHPGIDRKTFRVRTRTRKGIP